MPTSRNEALEFRASHAFVIGINNYPLLGANLEGAINDARAIAERLCVHQGFDNVLLMEDAGLEHIRALFQWLKSDHSKPLHIEQGTPFIGFEGLTEPYSAKIEWLDYTPRSTEIPLSEIDWKSQIRRTPSTDKKNKPVIGKTITFDKDKDSVVFYFAGHGYPGVASGKGPKGYLAATDSTKDLSGKVNLKESFITMEELYEALDIFDCKHTLLILDCCFSGKFRFADAQRGGPVAFLVPMYKERFLRYMQGKAWQVLASSGPNQTAADLLEAKDIRKNSPFAKTLIDALEGKADLPSIGVPGNLKDGIITATELYLYVSDKVEAMTRHDRPQNPSLFPMKKHDNGEFIFINPQLNIKKFKFNNDPRNNPYMGLKSFEKENHKLFYGRDEEIKEIVDILTDKERIDKVLFVSGGSSAGKSSIIQAGVFQRLQIKMHTQEETIELLKVRPTDLVEKHKNLEQIIEEKRPGNKRFEEVIDKLLSEDNFLLFIDQYEEIFTHSSEPILAHRVRQLFDAAISKENNYVLFSLRSDFEWKIKQTESLNKYFVRENIYRLAPMGLEGLRKALVGPAFWAMCQFASKEENKHRDDEGEDLINRILADVANAPAALSILSFTMFRMYETAKAQDKVNGVFTFTHNMYEEMGGVDGAISFMADDFYEKLKTKEEKILMRHLFLRMITLYDGTYSRRRVYYSRFNPNETFQLSELALDDEVIMDQYFSEHYLSELRLLSNQDKLEEIIKKLQEADLIVHRQDELGLFYIELAHDALIRKWDQCRIWLDELEKDSLLLQRQLWDDILEAQVGIKQTIAVNQRKDVKGASLTQPDIVLGTSSYWDNNPKLDSILKLLTSEISFKVGDTVSIHEDKFGGLSQESRNLFQKLTSPLSHQTNESLSEICADASFDSIVELFASRNHWLNEAELFFIYRSAVRKEKRYQILKAERDQAQQNALRSTSNTLANIASTISDRTQAYRVAELSAFVDNNNPKALEQLIKHYYSAYHLPTHQNFYCRGFPIFSPNSEEFVVYMHSSIKIFDAANGKENVSWGVPGDRKFNSICYSTDLEGKFLICCHEDNKVRIWQRPENKHTPWSIVKEWETGLPNSHHITVSKDGKKIAVGGDGSKIRVWEDWESHNPKVTEIALPLSNLSKIELSKHGNFVLCSFSRDQLNVQVWEVKENGKRYDLNDMPDKLAIASFADDEKYIVATSWANGFIRWDFENDKIHKFNTKGFTDDGFDLQYSIFDKHGRLAVGAATGHLYVFQLNVSLGIIEREIFSAKIQDANIAQIGFAPNGKYLVTSANNVVKLWNIQHYQGLDHIPNQPQNTELFPPNMIGTPIRRTIYAPDKKKMALIYGSHGDRRFFGTDSLFHTFDWENKESGFEFGDQTERINDLVFTKDGQRMYVAMEDGRIRCLSSNLPEHEQTSTIIIDIDESIDSISIYKNDSRLVAGTRSGKVILIKLDDGNKSITSDIKHNSRINKIAIAPNGRTLLTASRCVKAWDINLGTDTITFLENLYDDNEEKFSIEFSKDSSLFAIGGDSWLQVHETRSENNKSPLIGRFLHENRRLISQVYFSKDGSKIFSISGQIAHMWDIPTQKRLLTISPFNFLSGGQYFDTLSSTNETEFTGKGSKLLIMQEGGGVLFEFNISDILEKARNKKVIGALTPETIDLLELDDYFEAAGIYDKVFKTVKDERLLFSFGKYFQNKANESRSTVRRNQLGSLAYSYMEAASKIGELYRPSTYEQILSHLPKNITPPQL